MKEKPYRTLDEAIAAVADKRIEEIVAARREGPHLFSVDELRAAGALDVPPAWRKSLSAGVTHGQLPLFANEGTEPTKKETTPADPDGDELSE